MLLITWKSYLEFSGSLFIAALIAASGYETSCYIACSEQNRYRRRLPENWEGLPKSMFA